MDFVAIDLGASNTRYVSIDRKVNFVDNTMLFFKDGETPRAVDKTDDILENNLELIISRESTNGVESKYFPVHVRIGDIAMRSKKNMTRINQQTHKSKQPASYVSAVLCITLSKLKNPQIGNEINLFQLLPPSEIAGVGSKTHFIEQIIGKYHVELPRVGEEGTSVDFEIKDVYCCEEGRMAVIQFLLDEKHPENRSKYGVKRVMSIDVGESTTDVCVFDSSKFIERSAYTIRMGCRNCINSIVGLLEQEDKQINFNDAARTLIDGRRPNGAHREPIPEIIDEAKMTLAEDIISHINGYFNNIGISLNSIEYIIVSGGGSMPSSYIDEDTGKPVKVSDSITTHIYKAMKEYCSGVEVIHIEDDPRTANIRGLGMWAAFNKGEIKH